MVTDFVVVVLEECFLRGFLTSDPFDRLIYFPDDLFHEFKYLFTRSKNLGLRGDGYISANRTHHHPLAEPPRRVGASLEIGFCGDVVAKQSAEGEHRKQPQAQEI